MPTEAMGKTLQSFMQNYRSCIFLAVDYKTKTSTVRIT